MNSLIIRYEASVSAQGATLVRIRGDRTQIIETQGADSLLEALLAITLMADEHGLEVGARMNESDAAVHQYQVHEQETEGI